WLAGQTAALSPEEVGLLLSQFQPATHFQGTSTSDCTNVYLTARAAGGPEIANLRTLFKCYGGPPLALPASLALRTPPPPPTPARPAVPTRNDPPAPPPPPDPRNSVNPHIVIGAGTIAALGGVISAIMSGVQTIEPDQAQDAAVQCVWLVQYAIDHEAFAAS